MAVQFAGMGRAPGTGGYQPPGMGRVPQPTTVTQQQPRPAQPGASGENHIGGPFTMPDYGVMPRPPGWPAHLPWPLPGGTPLPQPGQPINPVPQIPRAGGTPGTPAPTTPQVPGTPAPTSPQTPGLPQAPAPTQPGAPQLIQAPAGSPAGAANNLGSLLAEIPPIHLPTRQSQNQLLAQAQQRANPVQALNRMGNSGITTDSAVNIQRLLGPTMQTMQQGALGAANLGIDDQLLRDKHLLQGLMGLGGLENDRLRQGVARSGITLDANEQLLNALLSMLGGISSGFNFGNLTGGFGDIAGAF